MKNPTIEPEIQEAILTALPEDGELALQIMAQLCANIVLSVKGANLDRFLVEVELNYLDYTAAETLK